MKRFKQYISEKKELFSFSKADRRDINDLYIRGVDDEDIVKWIDKNIEDKKGLSSEEIYNEFKNQKG